MAPTPWIPREPAFWWSHLGALLFVEGVTLASGLVYGSLDRVTLASSLLWALPFTAAVLGFRGLVLRRGWRQRRMRSLVPAVLGYSIVAGFAVIAVLDAMLLPVTWDALAARPGTAASMQQVLLRGLVANGLQTQLFIAAWAFAYLALLNAERAREAELLALRLGHSLKEAQLEHLSNQLNPHFLFNALNNIRFMLHEDAARADEHLVTLSELLRYTLDSSRQDRIALGPELDAVRAYVRVMQGQLEDRLRFELSAPPALSRHLIPPMLLAMLVENGVKHGLERLPQGGVLALDLRAEDGRLHVRVTNDRPEERGRDPDREHAGDPPAHGLRLGLANITERLRLLYGDRARLTTTAEPRRFVVDVTLPLEVTR